MNRKTNINLLESLPDWVEHCGNISEEIRLKSFYDLFRSTKDNEKWNAYISFSCECGCGREMKIHYFGFHYIFPNKEYDRVIGFDQKKENIREREANQVDVAHISNGVDNFKKMTGYLEGVQKAMEFKKNFYADVLFRVEFLLENHIPDITLLVEENKGNTKVILHGIKDSLPIVPLERSATSMNERLGVVFVCEKGDMLVAHEVLTEEQSISVEAFKASKLFNDLTVWVNTVLQSNNSTLSIKDIAVTAFRKEKELEKA